MCNIYKQRSPIQVSVLSKNMKRKLDTGHVAFHVQVMFSPNHGISFYIVENHPIQIWVLYTHCEVDFHSAYTVPAMLYGREFLQSDSGNVYIARRTLPYQQCSSFRCELSP
jgi:hypothetical protein